MTTPYTLYGAPVSLFTGKARSYLRKQGIDFVEVSPGSDRYLNYIVPTVGRWIIPCMETPDGHIIQDGADIIDHFEKGDGQPLRRIPVYPESPVLLAISHVFEMFGGEGLMRPAMHYRWNFDDENLDFLRSEFALVAPPAASPEEEEKVFLHNSGRMRKATVNFGATPETAPVIEKGFHEWLHLFDAHLAHHPYLLGGQPTIGDFGLVAAMWAHLFRDPVPQSLIKRQAPRVGRWVERMSTSEPYAHEFAAEASLIPDTDIPKTLKAMMRYVAEEWVPEITAHVEHANQWLADRPDLVTGTNGKDNPASRTIGHATFDWRGMRNTTVVQPYRFWLLQRLHDDLAAAQPADQAQTRQIFRDTGVEALLDLRTIRRVERANHLEVWGPVVDR
jgi:glutathione S-transferase